MLDHRADDLVPRNDRELGLCQVAVDDVQVGAAHAAGGDPDQDLPGPRHGHLALDERERRMGRGEHHRARPRLHVTAVPSSARAASGLRIRSPSRRARRASFSRALSFVTSQSARAV